MSKLAPSLLRIGIDCRLYDESGIGRYIRNLVSNLAILDQENEYFLFFGKERLHKMEVNDNFHKVWTNFRWYSIEEQVQFPILLKKFKLDLMHFPHFNMPIFYQGKFIVTIHDLIHQHFQMRRATTKDPFIYQIKKWGYKRVFESAVGKSKKIIVPSDFVKKILTSEWKIREDKIAVTHEAVDKSITQNLASLTAEDERQVMKKFKITPGYLFYVGNAHPHKNIEGLIRVFSKLKEKNPSLRLVLSGSDHYFWQRIRKQFDLPEIIYTGFVDDLELVVLYKNALVFVMPSFEEGFGIPVLEAMACSCPVVCSDRASLPEVAGSTALYFDPENLDDMVSKVKQMAEDKNLRKKLIEEGVKRYQQFSWEKLAKQTLKIYQYEGSHSS